MAALPTIEVSSSSWLALPRATLRLGTVSCVIPGNRALTILLVTIDSGDSVELPGNGRTTSLFAYWFHDNRVPLLSAVIQAIGHRITTVSRRLCSQCLSIDMKRDMQRTASQSGLTTGWWVRRIIPLLAEWLKLSSWPMSRSPRLPSLYRSVHCTREAARVCA